MELGPDYTPEFESLKELLLAIAQERSIERLLHTVVQRLAERPHVKLAALWLLPKATPQASHAEPPRAPDETSGLRLKAQAGSLLDGSPEQRSDFFQKLARIAPTGNAIARIAGLGKQVVADAPDQDPSGIGEPEWAAARGIRGFNGQPITFKGEPLGVVAVFTRIPTPAPSPRWLRIVADQIAAAMVNARGFEEIQQLKNQLQLENSFLRQEIKDANAFGGIIGQSRPIRQLMNKVDKVARTDATVLILGESGTGKELVAREIHERSLRRNRPLIRVNCASIPRELYESEFFGHVKGAFTGALRDRLGRFAAADGGTLFLDEVGDIPLELQGKLLRVLQERQYERVGEERTRTVDVRIIAATNRDLKQDVKTGRFRQDLYYRLNVFPVVVPPLRNHKEDIPLLAAHFLDQAVRKLHLPPARLTQADLALLQDYDWPGNVRELQNQVERALILAQNGSLRFDLPGNRSGSAADALPPPPIEQPDKPILTIVDLRRIERESARAALAKAGGRIHGPGGAAELLGLKPTTLIYRLKRLGLKNAA